MRFTVEHKYCKMTKVVVGESIADAFKQNSLDYNVWTIIDVENDD